MDADGAAFRSRAVRALVELHERHLRLFVAAWREAERADLDLPEPHEGHYASRAALLRHVLAASRGYLTWMAERLDLADPVVDPAPGVEVVAAGADAYLEHLLERWRVSLRLVEPAQLEDRLHPIWGVAYTIDSMLEHAVMHPIRHTYQLEELMARGPSAT